jgi:hypothetical protein
MEEKSSFHWTLAVEAAVHSLKEASLLTRSQESSLFTQKRNVTIGVLSRLQDGQVLVIA